MAGHATDETGPLFRAVHRNRAGTDSRGLTPDAVYKLVRFVVLLKPSAAHPFKPLAPRGATQRPACARLPGGRRGEGGLGRSRSPT